MHNCNRQGAHIGVERPYDIASDRLTSRELVAEDVSVSVPELGTT